MEWLPCQQSPLAAVGRRPQSTLPLTALRPRFPAADPDCAHPAARARVWVDHAEGVPPAQLPGLRAAVGRVCGARGGAGPALPAHAGGAA